MFWDGVKENEIQWREIKWDAIKESKVEPSGTKWSDIQQKSWNEVQLYEMDEIEIQRKWIKME